MPLSADQRHRRASNAARARYSKMTAEQRKALASRAWLASAAAAVTERWRELPPDRLTALRAALLAEDDEATA